MLLNTTDHSDTPQYYSILPNTTYKAFHCMALILFVLQASMSLYGADCPLGSTIADMNRRRKVYAVISPYVMSEKDLSTVMESSPAHVDLWLGTFTQSQKGIIGNLFQKTKEKAIQFLFPKSPNVPNAKHAAGLGLSLGATILDRKVLLHYREALPSIA